MKRIIAVAIGVALMLSAVTTAAFAQSRFDVKVIEADKEIEDIYYFGDNVRCFKGRDGKEGFLNEDFEIAVPAVYESALYYQKRIKAPSVDYMFDKDGKSIEYRYVTGFDENGIAVVSTSDAFEKICIYK